MVTDTGGRKDVVSGSEPACITVKGKLTYSSGWVFQTQAIQLGCRPKFPRVLGKALRTVGEGETSGLSSYCKHPREVWDPRKDGSEQ